MANWKPAAVLAAGIIVASMSTAAVGAEPRPAAPSRVVPSATGMDAQWAHAFAADLAHQHGQRTGLPRICAGMTQY